MDSICWFETLRVTVLVEGLGAGTRGKVHRTIRNPSAGGTLLRGATDLRSHEAVSKTHVQPKFIPGGLQAARTETAAEEVVAAE